MDIYWLLYWILTKQFVIFKMEYWKEINTEHYCTIDWIYIWEYILVKNDTISE